MTANFRGVNRRRADRYALRMEFRYRAAGLAWRNGSTVNMSGTGLLVEIPDKLPAGVRLEIAMDWPGVYHGAEKVRLFLIASVARAEGNTAALRIHKRQFCVVSPEYGRRFRLPTAEETAA